MIYSDCKITEHKLPVYPMYTYLLMIWLDSNVIH